MKSVSFGLVVNTPLQFANGVQITYNVKLPILSGIVFRESDNSYFSNNVSEAVGYFCAKYTTNYFLQFLHATLNYLKTLL